MLYSYDACGNLTAPAAASVDSPQIISQPIQRIVEAGQNATFSVVVADTSEVGYQWRFNETDIPGATGDSLLLLNVVDDNVGQYSVVVTNSVGSVTSAPAALKLRRNPAVNTSMSPRLVVYSDEGGSVTVAPIKPGYNLGDSVTLTATPFTDSAFAGWMGDLTTMVNPATLTMNGDKMVRARFYSTLLQLFAYSGAGGTLAVTPMKLDYALGEMVTLTPLPSPASIFLGWTGDLSGSDNPAILIMDKNKAVRARFATPASIPPGLIALWRGEADASDLTGRYDGAFYAGTAPAAPSVTAAGKVGGAFNFNGTVYVRVLDDPPLKSLKPAQFTAEAWVFVPAPSSARQTIIARGDTSNDWDLALTNNIPEFWTHANNFLPRLEPSAIPSNEWTHIAITFDGAVKRIYVNGIEAISQEESEAYGPAPVTPVPAPFTIGADQSGGELFKGRIDEVAFYDRALTGDEMLDIYNADFLGKNFSEPYILPPTQLPKGHVKTPYPPHQLVTIPDATSLAFSLSEGRPPPLMNLSPTGLISGTPREAGSFRFTVRATDSLGAFAEQMCVLQVSP